MSDTITLRMKEHFDSPILTDGDKAMLFRITEVEPALSLGNSIIFDFSGVRNMTDSFTNACFVQLFFTHREMLGSRIQFKGCSPIIQHFVLSALALADSMARAH